MVEIRAVNLVSACPTSREMTISGGRVPQSLPQSLGPSPGVFEPVRIGSGESRRTLDGPSTALRGHFPTAEEGTRTPDLPPTRRRAFGPQSRLEGDLMNVVPSSPRACQKGAGM